MAESSVYCIASTETTALLPQVGDATAVLYIRLQGISLASHELKVLEKAAVGMMGRMPTRS